MAPKQAKAAAPAKDAAAKPADKKAKAPAAAKDAAAAKPAADKPKKDAKAPAAKAAAPAVKPAAQAKPVAAAAAAPAPAAAAKPVAAAPAAAAKPAAAADKKPKVKKPKAPKAAKAAAPKQAEEKKDAPYLKKISKAKGEPVTEVEQQVAKALVELEVGKDLAGDLADLFIVSAKELEVAPGKKAVVIFVPFRQHNKFKRIQSRVVRELEKKLSKHVVILAQRTILSLNYSRTKKGEMRPRSRTLTAVHQAILDDLVYPTLIVAKRTRVRLDGTKLLKVYLDPKDVKEVDYKLKTFAAVYKKLTCKAVEFIFSQED
jgi:small subunit ribosomal protein S7e